MGLSVVLLFVLWFAVMITLYILNRYLKANWKKRMPDWVAESQVLQQILEEKITANTERPKLHNYLFKPWLTHLKLEFVNWDIMDEHIDEVINS
jgi:hypothetical protein